MSGTQRTQSKSRKVSQRFFATSILLATLTACKQVAEDRGTVVVVIESSPNSLDPRIGTDAQSERLDGLLFDALVRKDEHFIPQPWLATSWQQSDALHWTFTLHPGVHFSDGRPLEAADVAWTINSMIDGSLTTAKAGNLASVDRAVAVDATHLSLTLKHADQTLLFNLSDGMFGVVPRGSARDFGQHPVGSGAFRFVSAATDKEVIFTRTPAYWADTAAPDPQRIERLRFAVIPDAVTSALELRKGTADVAVNVVTLDMVHVLEHTPGLRDETAPGSPVMYLNFNCAHGPLADRRVRQAIAFSIDRQVIINAVWRGRARPAATLLPPGHWAAADPAQLTPHAFDPKRAQALLEAAGYHSDAHGLRLHLEMKTSTDETTRLLAIILAAQLRVAGIELTLRSAEFGTFYADVTHGAFEMYALRWIGANEDPSIFRYAYATTAFPPKGGNRGHYSNPQLDQLLEAAARLDSPTQAAEYVQAQQVLSTDLPAIPLWFPNNNVIHTDRVTNVHPSVSGSFDFLRTARLR